MTAELRVHPKAPPELDLDFLPAALWHREFAAAAGGAGGPEAVVHVGRGWGNAGKLRMTLLPERGAQAELNERMVERSAKFLLWRHGGDRILLDGPERLARALARDYAPEGRRSFDGGFFETVYGRPFEAGAASPERLARELPPGPDAGSGLGGHWAGCRIGFDLGASDRKCAALIDGKLIFTEERPWDPARHSDPAWHLASIAESISRAARELPRVDAIGGSVPGVLVDGEPRVSSLFRAVDPALMKTAVRRIFFELAARWPNAAFAVLNDGAVAALAGSLRLKSSPLLGLALGSSLAAGYVWPGGRLGTEIDELAFVPIDYRPDAPADHWSGERGCAGQYLSQQALVRLLPAAGIALDPGRSLPEELERLRLLCERGEPAAARVYRTIGAYLGYAVAQFAGFYELKDILVLGRVVSGAGGEIILEAARGTLRLDFPDLAERIRLQTLGELDKRHGQAVAAASLPPPRAAADA